MRTRGLSCLGWTVSVLALLLAVPSPASSATLFLRAAGDSTQEVPPTSSPATVFASFTYDDATRQLTFSIGIVNLEGTETATQIHGPALPGVNAPAIFSAPLGNFKSGTLAPTRGRSP
jgi:CHRD domain-containing protein